jgi:hypothetical protein
MKEEVETILENDQICYREDPETKNDYKRNLANKQIEMTEPLFEFLKEQFDIKLKVWYNIPLES